MADVSDTALYVAAGAFVVPKMADLLVGFFKGSVTRNIEAADRAQEKLEEKVERLGSEVQRLSSAHDSHQAALGSIDGRLLALDRRIAEQGKAYEEKIENGFKKLEVELNRRMAQMVGELETRGPRRRR